MKNWRQNAIAIVIIMLVIPVIIIQLHIIERITWQDARISEQWEMYAETNENIQKLKEKFFVDDDMENAIKRASKRLEYLKKSNEKLQKHYRKRLWRRYKI